MLWIWTLLATTVAAASVDELVGTWTTKSRNVLTGPGFYDPLKDQLLEPNLTGISYSFSADGYYEEALYRALANPADPSCPSGMMQWQHGSYVLLANGSLILTPIAVDGRQLLSEPCRKGISSYTRYNNTEYFRGYSVQVDKYHGIQRLDLTQADGKIMQPMYLTYRPPKMLPTSTLNPMPRGSRKKRDMSGSAFHLVIKEELINPDRWWWFGVLMTSLGGVAFFCS
ncbi:Protein r.t1.c1 [Penicillium subrubescens]|uniref:Protein ROT1 n=1 Tax=Penicillium subrubescens TaxID=1316194 RepID=A0A1Q5SNP9_9EURO|nr:Protein r.t1.c1 [Penicillium subrubescens]KAJ5910885.1 Protein r.t1.c1 [Penicillium subrubescens]OKO89590.1 Protein rot1 [Penicillium subrubescens]